MALAKMGYQVRLHEFHGTPRHPHGDVFKRLTKGQKLEAEW